MPMRKRLRLYLTRTEAQSSRRLSGESSPAEQEAELRELLVQIAFFQHERLIHLLVTLAVALLCVGTTLYLAAVAPSWPLLLLDALFYALLIPYLIHYFALENGVQALYRVYDRWRS